MRLTVDDQEIINETLAFINKVRDEVGDRQPLEAIPPGAPDNNCDCPIARGVKLGLGDAFVAVVADTRGVVLRANFAGVVETYKYEYPEAPFIFVRRFDEGEFEQFLDEAYPLGSAES